MEEQSRCLHKACLALDEIRIPGSWQEVSKQQHISSLILPEKNEMVKYFRYPEKCRDFTKTLPKVTLPLPFLHISGVPF